MKFLSADSPCLREESFANVQGLTALEWIDFQNFGGRVPPPLMDKIQQALRFTLEM